MCGGTTPGDLKVGVAIGRRSARSIECGGALPRASRRLARRNARDAMSARRARIARLGRREVGRREVGRREVGRREVGRREVGRREVGRREVRGCVIGWDATGEPCEPYGRGI
ncbi:hypothetical protein GCM10008992_05510 [Halorubrum aquaticum]